MSYYYPYMYEMELAEYMEGRCECGRELAWNNKTGVCYRCRLKLGEPCGHLGCLSHVTHLCEGCGRIAGGVVQRET